jgi:hypothetical protein
VNHFGQIVIIETYLAEKAIASRYERVGQFGRIVIFGYWAFAVAYEDPSGASFHIVSPS